MRGRGGWTLSWWAPFTVCAILAGGAAWLALARGSGLAVAPAAGAVLLLGWSARRAALARRQRAVEEHALRQRLDYLWKFANDAVLLVEPNGRILDANERAVEAYGYGLDELKTLNAADLRAPAARDRLEADLEQVRQEGSIRLETEHRRKDGSTFPVELSSRLFELDGRPLLYATIRDASHRRQAERAARLQASLLAHLNDAAIAVDRERRVTAWTGASERLYGYAAAEAMGRPVLELLQARIAEGELARVDAELERSGVARLDAQHRRKDGASLDVEVTAIALRDDAGRVVGRLLVCRDVSERKRAQAQLVFADRLASIGTLAAGVAHEINNPLSYLLANFEFLEDRLGAPRGGGVPDREALEAVREAREGARRIAEIVRGLRTFSRRDGEVSGVVPLDLRQPVQAALRIAEGQLRPRAQLEVELGEVPLVHGAEHELAQLAINLLVNAAQAIPEGQPVRHRVRVGTRTEGGRAVLEVSDTGAGIAPDHLARIFDPFFTTKRVGEGTGLGLAVCHGIVEALGGTIAVESAPGQGSLFRVTLPAAEVAGPPPPAPPPVPARRGRVLVVDDELLVCRAVARTLAGAHEVVALTDPAEAMVRLRDGEAFDVVLCDLMMPGLTGMDCFEALQACRPELARRVMFLTGGAFTEQVSAFLERVPNPRIEKPFDAERLRAAVAQAVARPPER